MEILLLVGLGTPNPRDQKVWAMYLMGAFGTRVTYMGYLWYIRGKIKQRVL